MGLSLSVYALILLLSCFCCHCCCVPEEVCLCDSSRETFRLFAALSLSLSLSLLSLRFVDQGAL